MEDSLSREDLIAAQVIYKKLTAMMCDLLRKSDIESANVVVSALTFLNAEWISNICATNNISSKTVYHILRQKLKSIVESSQMKEAIADKVKHKIEMEMGMEKEVKQ
jgi:hypothetical protein